MTENDLKMPPSDIDLLETRLAARLANALLDPAMALPDGVPERLRFARGLAVARAREARVPQGMALGSGNVAIWGGMDRWWPKLGAVLPVLVLAAGVIFLSEGKQREQVAIAAEIDAALLADDLPPAAYSDPGFVAFLKLQQP